MRRANHTAQRMWNTILLTCLILSGTVAADDDKDKKNGTRSISDLGQSDFLFRPQNPLFQPNNPLVFQNRFPLNSFSAGSQFPIQDSPALNPQFSSFGSPQQFQFQNRFPGFPVSNQNFQGFRDQFQNQFGFNQEGGFSTSPLSSGFLSTSLNNPLLSSQNGNSIPNQNPNFQNFQNLQNLNSFTQTQNPLFQNLNHNLNQNLQGQNQNQLFQNQNPLLQNQGTGFQNLQNQKPVFQNQLNGLQNNQNQNQLFQNQGTGFQNLQNQNPLFQNQGTGLQNLQNPTSVLQNQNPLFQNVQNQNQAFQNQLTGLQNIQSQNPLFQNQNQGLQNAQNQNPLLQNQNLLFQNQNALFQNQNQGFQNAQNQNPLLQNQNLLFQNQNPLFQNQNPLFQNQNQLLQNQNPLFQSQNLFQNQNPLFQTQNPLFQNQNPLFQNSNPFLQNQLLGFQNFQTPGSLFQINRQPSAFQSGFANQNNFAPELLQNKLRPLTGLGSSNSSNSFQQETNPDPNFSCEGKKPGYYADTVSGCRFFHICSSDPFGTLSKNTFPCPNGTLFNPASSVCQWWEDVNCPRASPEQNRFQNLFTGSSSISTTSEADRNPKSQFSQPDRKRQNLFAPPSVRPPLNRPVRQSSM